MVNTALFTSCRPNGPPTMLPKRYILPFIGALFFLSSCGETRIEGYTLTPPATTGGRMCIVQCQQARDYCDEGCSLKYRTCITTVQMRAMQDYDQYTREQITHNQPIEFRPRDFESSAPCEHAKQACNAACDTSYHSCYTSCGGVVAPVTSCTSMCF